MKRLALFLFIVAMATPIVSGTGKGHKDPPCACVGKEGPQGPAGKQGPPGVGVQGPTGAPGRDAVLPERLQRPQVRDREARWWASSDQDGNVFEADLLVPVDFDSLPQQPTPLPPFYVKVHCPAGPEVEPAVFHRQRLVPDSFNWTAEIGVKWTHYPIGRPPLPSGDELRRARLDCVAGQDRVADLTPVMHKSFTGGDRFHLTIYPPEAAVDDSLRVVKWVGAGLVYREK